MTILGTVITLLPALGNTHISAQVSKCARRALLVFVTALPAAMLLHLAGMH